MGMGQTAGGRGPGLGIVRGLEPGGSQPAQPTLHPRRPGSRQVGGLLWILSPAPEGVRSQQGGREGAGPAPTDHRGGGGPGGHSPGQTPSPGKQAEEPRLAPSGPPGLDQELWGCPGQVPSPGKDGVPPQAVAYQAVPALTRGGGAGDTLQAQSYFPPLSPICHKVASEKGTHVTRRPCWRPRGLPAPTQGAHTVHPGPETGPVCRRAAGPRAASPTGQTRATPSSKFLGGN